MISCSRGDHILDFFKKLSRGPVSLAPLATPMMKKKKKKKMNVFGYTYKIYDIGYKTEMMSKECNAGDPLETPGGLYRVPPSNENTIFKKMCMPNIKLKSVQCSFTMNVNQLQ